MQERRTHAIGESLMKRDTDIQRVFEIADDSLQGIIGYYMYVQAMRRAVSPDDLQRYLPDHRFQMTFSWDRFYLKQDLINVFKTEISEFYQCKLLLVELTSIFEAALGELISFLIQKGFPQRINGKKVPRYYKSHIVWALNQVRGCDLGDKKAINRLPQTFGIIDNARRLRNLIAHNHWVFNKFYEEDAITLEEIEVDMHPFYEHFKETERSVPVVMDWRYLERLILAHIEVLHVLHNSIQKEYFGVNKGYSYAREQKPIAWHRAIWGKANVELRKTQKHQSS